MDSTLLSGIAVLITAIVGVFSFMANKKAAQNTLSISGATTAISGLEVLSQQHALEIERINKEKNDCLLQLAKLEGQVEAMKHTNRSIERSNQDILSTLKESAVTLIADNKTVATKVEKVRKDLL